MFLSDFDFYMHGEHLQYCLSNVLVLKKMYDRGYNVKNICYDDGPILKNCLDAFAGQPLEWEDVRPDYNEKYKETLDENAQYIYEDFMGRDHYKIPLPLPGLEQTWKHLTGKDKESIASMIKARVFVEPDFIENFMDYGVPDSGFYDWEWLYEDGTVKGIYLYLFDVPMYCEYPPTSTEMLGILDVADLIENLKKERLECTNRAN